MREALISFPMFGDGFVLNPPAYLSIGSFKIYMYGIVIAFGFLLAILYTARFCGRVGEKMDDIYDYLIWAVPTAIVCARLYYVIFNYSIYRGDFWSIFRIRDGGLAIYGGVIGAVAALILCCRHKKRPVYGSLDVAAFGLLIGQLVGRWGNFFNREAFGYETTVFCRMGLTLPGQETIYVHPTFLYESLWNLLGLIILHIICKKRRRWSGQFFTLYVFWYGLGRMFIEGLRTDSLWLVPGLIRVSQLLALVSMLAALAVYLVNIRRLSKGLAPILGKALDSGAEPCQTQDIQSDNAQPDEKSENQNKDQTL